MLGAMKFSSTRGKALYPGSRPGHKYFDGFLLTVLVFLLLGLFAFAYPGAASAAISVTVTGDGVTTPTTFTGEQLQAMTQVQSTYSTINTWPTKKWYVAKGVRLADLLDQAGIKDNAKLITVTAIDGYKMTFTRKELLDDPRYYYPGLKENHEFYGYITGSPDGAVEVDTILALSSVEGSDDPDFMNDQYAPLLVIGQRWVSEQTNNTFVKKVSSIEVSTETPGKWETPAAAPDGGIVPAGTPVALSTSDMDGDNIHYTIDGSDPTLESPIYNWIKKRWWVNRENELATINHPIDVDRSMTIKAIAIGFGKDDSDIVSFDYQVVLDDPPALTADTIDNSVYRAVDITFPDDAVWRAAITGMTVEGSTLDSSQYTVTSGNINIIGDVFATAGDYAVEVAALGYSEASVTQQVLAPAPALSAPVLTADDSDNTVGQALDITFPDDADWRAAVTGITVEGSALDSDQYTVTAGNINIAADVFATAGEYEILIKADGYQDAGITQTLLAQVAITAPTNSQEFTSGEQVTIRGIVRIPGSPSLYVNGPDGQIVYGPENVTVINGEFEAICPSASTTAIGLYTIHLDGGSPSSCITGTFRIKAEGTSPVQNGEVILTITGEGVTNEVNFTLAQLQDMEQYQHDYSVINTWPTKKWYVGEGVKLRELLDEAGIKNSATLITFTSEDGYYITLTVKELLKDTRYCFPNFKEGGEDGDGHIPGSASGKREVDPIIALVSAEGDEDPDYMTDNMNDLNMPLLMLGQRAVTEQTGNLFVKKVREIEVSTDSPSQWDAPVAEPDSGEVAPGTLIALSNENMDDDKIYYTTDGSTPSYDSTMYNWVASRWWGARGEDVVATINHPIKITEDTTIKAITIGPGSKDSKVVTFEYKVSTPSAIITEVQAGAGGTISLDGEITIEVPADALTETGTVEMKVEQVTAPPEVPSGFKFAGNVYEITVNGENTYSFADNITITISFDPDLVDPDDLLAIYYYDEDTEQWVNLGGVVSGNTISVQVDHFTKFGVLAFTEEVPQPVITINDIAGHWAETNIYELVARGAINGYPDGSFKPDGLITRAEFATILARAFELDQQSGKIFNDTSSHWSRDYIGTAAANGIITGYSDTIFAPDDFITREQMAVMIFRAAHLSSTAEEVQFTDKSSISEWAREAVAAVTGNGIMKGYPDNTIQPQGCATRAEAVTVIVNALHAGE